MDAAQCLVELAGFSRIDLDLFLELTGASLLGIASQTSGEQSAQSLYSPEDEVDDLLRMGLINGEVPAN